MTTPPAPVDALRRVAFLLERELAPTYRVKAFRTAAAVLAALPPDELDRRLSDGTVTALKGVGERTAAVATAAHQGRTDPYLAELEDRAGPLAEGGEELRRALRGDLHLHSDWSDGGSPPHEMALAARGLGHSYAVLTDHSPRLTVARGLTAERLRAQIELVHGVDGVLAPFRFLTGIEVDIHEDGTLDQTDELLGELDVVVASVHSGLRSEPGPMTDRMVRAVRDRHTDVLGHCTGRLVTGGRGQRPESRFDAAAVFAACAEEGVAVEINSRPERRDPPGRLIEQALEAGCLFSIDTDAHAPGQLDFLAYGCARAAEHGVPAERVVNTWPLEDLLAWTRRRD